MVKLGTLSEREIAEEEKFSKLVEITGGLMRTDQIIETSIAFSVFSNNGTQKIYVHPSWRTIEVYDTECLSGAVKLAEAYEAAFPDDGEFTVKYRRRHNLH